MQNKNGLRLAGIDIGSRATKLVVLQGGTVLEKRVTESGFDPFGEARRLLEGIAFDRIMATGYGRGLLEISLDVPTVTEIKAHAMGARMLFPRVETILDMGGQDTKAIALNREGRIRKFEMNDRCAAGTGKFLEIMARTLGFPIEAFGEETLLAGKELTINSMCTVFAESEVTSLLSKGMDRRDIALGIHRAAVRRASGMLKRVSADGPVVFTGGVARNPCMQRLLEDALGIPILVPDEPHLVGALGAALLAGENGRVPAFPPPASEVPSRP